MKQNKWRVLLVFGLTLWAAYGVAPSIIYFSAPKDVRNSAEEMEKRIPDWLPQKHVKLGLDLQGGIQMVLGVGTDTAVDNKLSRIGTEAKRWADDNNYKVEKAFELAGKQTLRIELSPEQDEGLFREAFKKEFPGLIQTDSEGNALLFQYDGDEIARIKQSAIEQAERVIRNRIDKWGVAEPVINRRKADNSVLVQLPGFRDPEKAKELLGRTAQLRFKIVDDKFTGYQSLTTSPPEGITVTDNGGQTAFSGEDREALIAYLSQNPLPADRELYFSREEIAAGKKARYVSYVVEAQTSVTGDDVLDAFVTEDASGLDRRPEVALQFTGPGGKRFGDVTGENVGRRLAIILDDVIESAPNIQTKIANGQARITLGNTGGFQQLWDEANELALILKSGALPATIEVLEERQVGATLGPELADQGVKGAMIGLILVFVFVIGYYRRPGVIASIALGLNGVFLLALMAGFGFSLTLPGIAGFILTLGMAVDANVLINERIRQELREGKNARKAIDNGFDKVFWTVFDANVTSLIAALVLLETNSSGPIRGFAITLILGLLVSMFTAIYCSRLFFDLVASRMKTDSDLRKWLGGELADKARIYNFNYLRYGKVVAVASAIAVFAVYSTSAIRGVNWGVDFAGGAEMMVAFGEETDTKELEAVASEVGIKEMTSQHLEGEQASVYLVRFGEQTAGLSPEEAAKAESAMVQNFRSAIETKLAAKKPEILQVDFVGPQIGQELRTQGLLSVLYAIIGVLLYVGLRFDKRFAPGALAKMFVDVSIIVGFYIFFWRSFDLTSVAAFLTVIGYSVNDTIVIYDRIREHATLNAKRGLGETINLSLNECLSRSINTSVTTLLALIGILILGTGQIFNFTMAMALGVVAATLSTQFLASPIVFWLENWNRSKAQAKSATGASQSATART